MAKYKKRADGRYATSVTYCGKKFYFTAKTSPELDRKVQEFKIAKRSGTYSSGMLLEEWCQHWLIAQQGIVEPNTLATYESHCRVHIIPELGKYPLCNIQPPHVRDFIAKLLKKLASRTVEHIYVTLKALLTQAVNDDLLAKHPMRGLKKPKVTRTRPWVALTEAQLKDLLSVVKNPTHLLIIKLAATSGLRRSELLGLRFEDVNLQRNTVSVIQTNKKINSRPSLQETTKTSSSRRTVSVPAALMPVIKEQIRTAKLAAFSDPLWISHDLLFPGEHGNPRNPDYITALIRDYGKRANMPRGFCFNSLRHTSASLLLQHGVNYKVVQERLGHSTPMLTLSTYSHVMPGQDAAAAETLSNII